MKNNFIYIVLLIAFLTFDLSAGNKDRVGQAGATELLILPWARSAGWHGSFSAGVQGVEAMRLNVGGLAYVKKTELNLSYTNWLNGSGINIASAGFAIKLGESGVMGLDITSLSFGEILETTYSSPDYGTGGKFSPSFIQIGLAYSRQFSNSISGGLTVRMINESIANAKASGVAIDAGIQYVTGPEKNKDRAKFGIALRNVGTPMKFSGDGLNSAFTTLNGTQLTGAFRAEKFEMPSLLNIGLAYDLWEDKKNRLTIAGNFTSNSFSKDHLGLGLEYAFKEMFMLRGGMKYEDGMFDTNVTTTAFSGFSGGVTIDVPFKEDGPRLAVDYAYRTNNFFSGTHSVGLRLNF